MRGSEGDCAIRIFKRPRRPSSAFPRFESYQATLRVPAGPCLDSWWNLDFVIAAMVPTLQFHGIAELVPRTHRRGRPGTGEGARPRQGQRRFRPRHGRLQHRPPAQALGSEGRSAPSSWHTTVYSTGKSGDLAVIQLSDCNLSVGLLNLASAAKSIILLPCTAGDATRNATSISLPPTGAVCWDCCSKFSMRLGRRSRGVRSKAVETAGPVWRIVEDRRAKAGVRALFIVAAAQSFRWTSRRTCRRPRSEGSEH